LGLTATEVQILAPILSFFGGLFIKETNGIELE